MIEDDGQGLNREKILKKGKTKGLVAEGAVLTDHQIDALIFEPGFSTADRVTDVSGRGVGMDVVKKAIEKLYELAGDLKSEVEKTDSAQVLSLAMIKKAEEIEKLAKDIKSRAKG